MALFRKLFYRKPPDGLLEICERVYVFDCCFTTEAWEERNYKVYIGGIVGQLRDHFPEASFLTFNFREGDTRSLMADVLSEYDMTIMDYPRHYEGCPLLTMELIHHFLRSSESWLSLGPNNLLLMHCEWGGWPVLAFMLAALLIYRKQYSGEQKTLDMIYRQAPRELLHLLSSLNPIPSQLRYLQYVSRRNVVSEWPPLDRALTLDCVILRFIPDFDGVGGCRPIFRICGQDPFLVGDRAPKVLYSTPKKSKSVRVYKQAESELVKIDINCHIQGDVVVECLSLNDDMERVVMMFRVVFNTAFIRSNILMLNRDEIDTLWDARDQFPKDFRAELLFSEMDAASSVVPVDLSFLEEKEGLPVEAFAKVHEIFSHVEWLDHRADVALNMLQHLSVTNIFQENSDADGNQSVTTSPRLRERSPRNIQDVVNAVLENSSKISMSSVLKVESVSSLKTYSDADVSKKAKPQDLHMALQLSSQSNIMGQQTDQSSPVRHSSMEDSPSLVSMDHSAPQPPQVKPRLHDHESFESAQDIHPKNASQAISDQNVAISSGNESLEPKNVSVSPPPPPPPPPLTTPFVQSSKSSESLFNKEGETYSHDRSQLSLNSPAPPPPSLSTTSNSLLSTPPALPISGTASSSLLLPPTPPPPSTPLLDEKPAVRSGPPPPPPPPLCSGQSESRTTSSSVPPPPPPPPAPAFSSNSSKVSSAPPPPPPTPPLKENPTIRVGPPTPPPPPLHSGQIASLTTSSPVPPSPPPAPTLSLSPSGVPSAPPPPVPTGSKGVSKTVSGSPEPPSAASNGSTCPAPPLSSPSSAKGRMLRSVNSRSHQTKKLKPLHWLKLTRAVQGSLWADAQKSGEASRAPEIDMSELESLFSASAPNSDHGRNSGLRGSRGPKSEKVQLIDHRRAYNCEIMLSKVKVPLHDLMSSVLALEDSALDVDQVDNLIKFCPTKEEMELLKGYTGEKEKLGKCELFFLEIMKVPRVESKLRVFSFKIQFDSQVSDLRSSLNVVNSASEQIRNSAKLKRIMQTILSLGNALNQGTARGSAIGFRLDSLLKLTETRAQNKNMTLMHYLCKVLADKLPELLDFSKYLDSLERASKIQLKFLAEEMQAVNKGLEKVVQELSMSENDGPISENFRKVLKAFLRFAEGEVRTLASLYSGVGRNVDALILYFGEDPARCPFEQVISTMLNFVRMFNRAHEENCKQLELEMKKSAESEKSKINASHKESLHTPIKSTNVK